MTPGGGGGGGGGGVTPWVVTLDDPGICSTLIPNPNRVVLSLNDGGIQIGSVNGSGAILDWGDSTVAAYTSTQQWGEVPVDYRVASRTVTIPLILGADDTPNSEEYARANLQAKVALIQREGGWLKRQRLGGQSMYADITWATLNIPDSWGETGGVEPNVVLTLTCLPDFYGDEILLDVMSTAGTPGRLDAVLTQSGEPAMIAGDHPARCRIIVNNTSTDTAASQVWWGLRSRNYDSASTAVLHLQAQAMTPDSGASLQTLAGSEDTYVMQGTYSEASSLAFMQTLTHQGSYTVLARACWSGAATGVSMYLVWKPNGIQSASDTTPIQLTKAWQIVSLGEIRIDAAPVGVSSWNADVWVVPVGGSATVSLDSLLFIPTDEAAGCGGLLNNRAITEVRTEGIYGQLGAEYGSGPVATSYAPGTGIGDLPRLPPSGMENRPCELVVRPLPGFEWQGPGSSSPDSLIPFTVQVAYRPVYLGRP